MPIGFVVTWPTAPRWAQALEPRPSGNHGAKWSETPRPSKPASSAALDCSTISVGVNSSVDAANQNCVCVSVMSLQGRGAVELPEAVVEHTPASCGSRRGGRRR